MLEVQGSEDFELMTKLTSPSGLVSNTNCVRQDRVLNIEGFDSNILTFVRFINTTDNAIGAIQGTLYDADGNVIGTANITLVDSLAPKEQVWVNRDNFAIKVGEEWNGEAMLEVDLVNGLRLVNLNFVNGETFFNFSCFEDSTSGTVFLQRTSTSQNISFTHLVNTADVAQQFTGTLYNGVGDQLGAANQPLHTGSIAAKARLILSSEKMEAAFSVSPWSGPAMLEVQGNDIFELMTKLTSPSGLISNTNCVRQDQVHNAKGFDSPDMTFVRFINTGSTTLSNIRGTMYNSNGITIGSANQILLSFLAPKAAIWLNRDTLSAIFSDTWNGEAMVEVDSPPDALRLLNLNRINNETFLNFSCYERGTPIASTESNWYIPPPLTTWQWQLQEVVNTSYQVDIYDIDLFDSPITLIEQLQASGARVICYFSAGSFEGFRSDSSQFSGSDLGNTLSGFEDERWLDIRSANVRSIMELRMDLAQQKGCDGVEPDNMDGYVNDSGFSLTAEDQLSFNRLIAAGAHSRNLSVGLKNDMDQIEQLVDDFDFSVNEQCFEFSECDLLAPFISAGKAVLNAEYLQVYVDDESTRDALCTDSLDRQFSTLVLPLKLDDEFRYSCL